MKTYLEDFKTIYREERWTLVLMILNFIFSIVLFVYSIINLNPNDVVVKIGYGDIGGYRDGIWADMLVFPIIAVIFGVLHTLIAVKLFHRRGAGMTKFFLITTTLLIAGAFIVLIRLLKEG